MSRINTGLVTYHLDPDEPLVLTAEEEAALQRLAQKPDEEIDYSDIPPLPASGWRRVSDLVPAENKQQVTLRLDADLLAFFKGTGKRYQSRINAVLREYMLSQQPAPKSR